MNTYRLILCPLSAALILALVLAFAYRPPAAVAQPGAPQPLTWIPCDGAAAVRRRQQPPGRTARPQPRRADPVRGYVLQVIEADGAAVDVLVELRGDRGQLQKTQTLELRPLDLSPTDPAPPVQESRLAFYRDDFVLVLDATGQPVGTRADFVRDANGRVAWLRQGGRLYQHVG